MLLAGRQRQTRCNAITLGLFGWVANSQPDSSKPTSSCLVVCLESEARLHGATNHPLARLKKTEGEAPIGVLLTFHLVPHPGRRGIAGGEEQELRRREAGRPRDGGEREQRGQEQRVRAPGGGVREVAVVRQRGGERREVVVGDGGGNGVGGGGLGVGVGELGDEVGARSMWNCAKERTKTKHPATVQAHL